MKPSFVLRVARRKCRHAERNGGKEGKKASLVRRSGGFFACSDCEVKSDLLQFISGTKYSVLKCKQTRFAIGKDTSFFFVHFIAE